MWIHTEAFWVWHFANAYELSSLRRRRSVG